MDNQSSFADRIVRAVRLEGTVYEEVEHDRSAMTQAAALVMLSSVAAGVGLLLPGMGIAGLFWGVLASLIGWIVWAAIIYIVGVKIMGTPETSSNMGEILRVLGFASAPGLLRIFGVIGPVRGIVFLLAFIWMLLAMVVAVRQALDYRSTGRAAAVCAVGWIIQLAITAVILWINGYLIYSEPAATAA